MKIDEPLKILILDGLRDRDWELEETLDGLRSQRKELDELICLSLEEEEGLTEIRSEIRSYSRDRREVQRALEFVQLIPETEPELPEPNPENLPVPEDGEIEDIEDKRSEQ